MIQTSKDILFLVLGISILAISLFLVLLLYYLVRLTRKFYRSVQFFEKIGIRVNEITKTAERKIKEITLLPLLSEAIKAIIEFLKERKKPSSAKATEDEKEKEEKK